MTYPNNRISIGMNWAIMSTYMQGRLEPPDINENIMLRNTADLLSESAGSLPCDGATICFV